MRLFIAEKPSLGRAIAQYLLAAGQPVGRSPTHIIAGQETTMSVQQDTIRFSPIE